ncbi:hypothetical protein ACLMAB_11005 [Brevibacillus laterosporus]
MKILVIWRLLTVGGVNAGWRNRAMFFKKYGIETEFLYTSDLGGMHMMQDVARVYLTADSNESIKIIRDNHYDAIVVVDTKEAYRWLKTAQYTGPVIVEARTPEIIKLSPIFLTSKVFSQFKLSCPPPTKKEWFPFYVTQLPLP